MAQPSAADIDSFRSQFFERVIQDERTKENQRQRQQKTCYHRYHPVELYQNGYMECICTKCEHVIYRRCADRNHTNL